MKKRNYFLKFFGIAVITSSLALFAACSNTQTSKARINEAHGIQDLNRSAENSISLDSAINIALEHAQLARDTVRFTKTQLDSNDTIPNYEIEFIADGIEYEYEVAVSNGELLKIKTEKSDYDEFSTHHTDSTNTADTTKGHNSNYISIDEAKAITLKDAGINTGDVVFEKTEFDGDDFIPHYDIEFHFDSYEYDYEINAKTGSVISSEKDYKD